MKRQNSKPAALLVILALLALLALLAALGIHTLNSRTANSQPARIDLAVSDYATLCNLLEQKEVKAGSAFRLFARLLKLDRGVRPGSYVVQPHMRTLALVRKLRNGQQDPIRLTIGKFRTPDQLNNYLNSKLMHDDFNVTLDSFHLILPDTYEFYWTVTPEQFMQRMAKEYDAFWHQIVGSGEWGVDSTRGQVLPTTHYPLPTPRDVVILASIVEEETNYNPEKPLIASVYLNRLKRGMPLQADPTVKYALGDFALKRILNRHLSVDSPFNTYRHPGLPPAPICLPSKATVKALLNAPQTDYIYFCASEKMDGTHRFAATLAEHNRNAAAFHRALDTRGIR